jgi:hypothetical protein
MVHHLRQILVPVFFWFSVRERAPERRRDERKKPVTAEVDGHDDDGIGRIVILTL